MTEMAIQDFYPDDLAVCYGCGRLNAQGLHIRSTWQGDQSICVFEPRPYHTAIPGFVYGGLIASLIDCHSTGTAAAAAYRAANREPGSLPAFRYVTASLHVEYLRPTPLGPQLILRARVKQLKGRKAVIECELYAEEQLCARGQVVTVQIPEGWGSES
jgi:acyl-coenzyme A thioesterase PaaI-like protein